MRGRHWPALVLALTLMASACGDDSDESSPEGGESSTTTAPSSTSSTSSTTTEAASSTTTEAPVEFEKPPCQLQPADAGPAGTVDVSAEVVVDGLEVPWGLAFLPDGDMLVTERMGRVRLIRDGELVPEPVLEVEIERLPPELGLDVLGSEGGLLGILLHPDFESNRQFYLFSNIASDEEPVVSQITRHVLADDGHSAELDRVIVDGLPAGVHHQGGRMQLGPDGMIWFGVGADNPFDAQDPELLAGKLHRMDLDGGIPADNPDPTSTVVISGIRNTQGFDWWDDDHLVMVDHGPSGLELDMPELRGFDEVNVATIGDNLGWPEIWGCEEGEGLRSPVLSFEVSVPPTGAIYYRGDHIPEWENSFLFTTVGVADLGDGRHLHRVVLADDNPNVVVAHETYFTQEFGRLRTIAADPDGVLHMMTSNCDGRGECPETGDAIIRLGPGG